MLRAVAWWFLRRSKTLRRVKRRIKHDVLQRPRRVPRDVGVAGFIDELNRRRCRYVVLRWFDHLPEVDEGGDLDILVDDRHAETLDRFLTRSPRKGSAQCDVYSVHGLPSFAHRRFAYYPPHVAEQLLERAVQHKSGARVPCPEDHFYSLAFHVLYHKGYSAGLPVSDTEGPRGSDPRHDYAAVLRDLALRLRISVPINMVALDHELERRGWRPPPDTLLKWATSNEWCRDLAESIFRKMPTPTGFMVCLVREQAQHPEAVAEIERRMDDWGFIRLTTRVLDATQKERASRLVRGGNWERGPYPLSGGPPSVMIAAVDPTPSVPSSALCARHPGVDNGRVFDFKKQVRDWWNCNQSASQRCNIMHTSDNAAHAVHYVEVIMPDEVETLLEHEGELRSRMSSSEVA